MHKHKTNLNIGDKIKIISGDDKGKTGLIKKIIKQTNQIIIEGINLKVKHIKPTQQGQVGEIKNIEFPIHISNVVYYKE
uniref:50S ribosomal protein L24 n=1 Tax=Choristocarpus tenellus TaxID=116065 RepID=UPI002E78D494|nr:50S ribosomal protein L24 [Choristocarpus tenellus]WAM62322.1 50S ribosomal protein L24 [Choristocarpus tenellus]